MNLLYLILIITHSCIEIVFSELRNEATSEILDIDLPKNHLSQYFNNLPKFTKRFNETASEFYKDFLSGDEYDRELCWGYEYQCKKPNHVHRCPGNHSGYVDSKETQLDVFDSQADFGIKSFKIIFNACK